MKTFRIKPFRTLPRPLIIILEKGGEKKIRGGENLCLFKQISIDYSAVRSSPHPCCNPDQEASMSKTHNTTGFAESNVPTEDLETIPEMKPFMVPKAQFELPPLIWAI